MTPRHHLLPALLTLLAQGAGAGPLADPTRPPAALAVPGSYAPASAGLHRSNLDTARAIGAAARAANPPPPPAPIQLQAVQVRADGTALAMVNGRMVKVGDQIDGRSVLAIDGQGLLLKGSVGPERVWLLAGSPKQRVGSISDSRSAHYQAEPAAGEPLAGEGSAERSPVAVPGNNPTAGAPRPPATPVPLALAERTIP